MFDPAEVWQHTSEFDKTYADYLASIGMEASLVEVKGGSIGEKFYLIKKKEMIPLPQPPQEKGPKEILNKMMAKQKRK